MKDPKRHKTVASCLQKKIIWQNYYSNDTKFNILYIGWWITTRGIGPTSAVGESIKTISGLPTVLLLVNAWLFILHAMSYRALYL